MCSTSPCSERVHDPTPRCVLRCPVLIIESDPLLSLQPPQRLRTGSTRILPTGSSGHECRACKSASRGEPRPPRPTGKRVPTDRQTLQQRSRLRLSHTRIMTSPIGGDPPAEEPSTSHLSHGEWRDKWLREPYPLSRRPLDPGKHIWCRKRASNKLLQYTAAECG